MATSPTVLAGTSAATPSSVSSVAPSEVKKLPIFPLFIAIVVGVVVSALGIGAVVYYLVRTGRLPIQESGAHKAETVGLGAAHAMALEPLLVNLADAGGTSYLRVAMTLRVADVEVGKSSKAKEEKAEDDKVASDAVACMRDTTLMVLGRQTSDGLLAVGGKEHLKVELKKAFAEHNPDLRVMDVFFTDFLVQR